VLVLDLDVALNHGDSADHHRQPDLFVVEGLVADIEDELWLGFVAELRSGVGGGHLGLNSRVSANVQPPAALEA
jgi:hypothetical protein